MTRQKYEPRRIAAGPIMYELGLSHYTVADSPTHGYTTYVYTMSVG